ncbi:flavin reductase family protein [Sporolactobacillus kofuensis]|uniref:Flavin reductase family protein n=1 Tax=Sporolactobacillus kofuensis TaxID=269672 RepID=A0ABW1WJ06_9BACL|nr:flavin reductase family protein [Sporolactobacillus kofuensis]MCO7176531.1 flavin reductase family protein [Sporolactobacillus kofuensis]
MISIDPNELPGRENYKFLTGSIIPRPVAFVTTESAEGVLNAAPFSYFTIITDQPPMISVSVQRFNGAMKDTSRNAIEKGEFVVHISDESYIDQINNTAKPLSSNESEVEDSGLTPVNSIKVSVQGVKEANIRLECVLERALELGGTDGNPSCDLLIGRVVYYHIREDLYEHGRINATGLKPISRLAGSTYAKLGDTFDLIRPV